MDTIKKQLESVFAEQATASATFLATLEPIADAPDRVKLTPFGLSGCGCDQALTVAVSHLESMTPEADRWHDCCSKRLRVMRIALKPEATVSAHDVVAATVRRAAQAHVAVDAQPEIRGGHGSDCWNQELHCLKNGQPAGLCHTMYLECMGAYDSASRRRNSGDDGSVRPMIGCRGNPRAAAHCIAQGNDPGYCWDRYCR